MASNELQTSLINLQATIQRSEALVMAARSQASIPTTPHAPVVGLTVMADALAAQQEAIKKLSELVEALAQ